MVKWSIYIILILYYCETWREKINENGKFWVELKLVEAFITNIFLLFGQRHCIHAIKDEQRANSLIIKEITFNEQYASDVLAFHCLETLNVKRWWNKIYFSILDVKSFFWSKSFCHVINISTDFASYNT